MYFVRRVKQHLKIDSDDLLMFSFIATPTQKFSKKNTLMVVAPSNAMYYFTLFHHVPETFLEKYTCDTIAI